MKWWWKILLGLLVVVVVVFLGISIFLGHSMTRVERVPVTENPSQLGLDYREVSFTSTDDELNLHGWLLPVPGSQKVIIMVHGADQHRADPSIGMLTMASELVDHGYNILMFDLRGHGESEGNMMSAGYYERRDLTGAIAYVKELGFHQVGVIGFSVGAVTALMTAAENSDIRAIVADSCFTDLEDLMAPEFSKRTKLPRFFLPPVLFVVKLIYGVDFHAIRPIDSVPLMAQIPVFFIQGDLDETVLPDHVYDLYQASQNPQNEMWLVPGAGHVKAYQTYPAEYIHRITSFFDIALADDS